VGDTVGEPVGPVGRAEPGAVGAVAVGGLVDGVGAGAGLDAVAVAGGFTGGDAGWRGWTVRVGAGPGCWTAARVAGAGRTNRYVVSVSRKNSTSTIVDLRIFRPVMRIFRPVMAFPSRVRC
jgi:hypothetical protein